MTNQTITLRWQYARNGTDITDQALYAEDDADLARAWDHDFCQIEVTRHPERPDTWQITGSDAVLPEHIDSLTFRSPTGALDHLAEQFGFRYQITT